MSRDRHWEDVYSTKSSDSVSWYEAVPEFSLTLLKQAGLLDGHAVIDIGGGASSLVDALAGSDCRVAVLDISAHALDVARERLGTSPSVEWIVADVTTWHPETAYDFWHDRAAFHFLTEADDRAAYAANLDAALKPGGAAIIGTFALDGPEKCSGLPVQRYDAQGIVAALGGRLILESEHRHEHTTPWGSTQAFTFAILRKPKTSV